MLLFGITFLYFSYTRKAIDYIHPKLVPIMFACGIIFVITAFLYIVKVKSIRVENFKFSQILFIIPILMAFIFPATSVNSNFVDISSKKLENAMNNDKKNSTKNSTEVNEEEIKSNNDETKKDGMNIKEKKLIMDTENFLPVLEAIYNSIDEYVGWEIAGEGYIYKEDKLDKDKFVLARSLMSCCAADAQVIGIICDYNKAVMLKANDWFHVEGKITKYDFEDTTIPLLEVVKIEKIEKPESDFVYPY